MQYFEHSPNTPLSGYIQSIWAMESENEEDVYPRSLIMPDGIVEIIFHYGDPFYTWQDGSQLTQPENFAISMMRKYIEIASAKSTGFISVRFFPWGAYHFFAHPVRNFLDQTIDAGVLWGEDSKKIITELKAQDNITKRFQLVETFLENKLRKYKQEDRAGQAIKYIRQTKGQLTIDQVCKDMSISKKQLERNFLATVGTMPKLFSRITRFLDICAHLEDYRGKSITQLSYECGFYDQSHFIKEFRTFSGFTPKEYFEKENVYFSDI